MPSLRRPLAVAACSLLAACAEVAAPSAPRPTPTSSVRVDREDAAPACRLELVDLSVETTAATGFASAVDRGALLRALAAASAASEAGRGADAAQTVARVQSTVAALEAAQRLDPASAAPLREKARTARACLAPTAG